MSPNDLDRPEPPQDLLSTPPMAAPPGRKKVRIALGVLAGMFMAGIAIIYLCNGKIERETTPFVYSDVQAIPANKVGLLLGTARILGNGRPNAYFTYRIQAALNLYRAGKVKALVITGDNHIHSYNEPQDMEDELVKNGIPRRAIYLDYAGFRTLDSVVRCQKIFGQTAFTVISQEFHNRRALFIARRLGWPAIGFNAKDLPLRYGLKVVMREYMARVKVFFDLWFGTQPKFLGEKITID